MTSLGTEVRDAGDSAAIRFQHGGGPQEARGHD